ncbi:MAG: hypothetical protein IT514_04830 [Burkholderiales bacterium]|nr:hypothetical protein [Burkholderiales bacterium]
MRFEVSRYARMLATGALICATPSPAAPLYDGSLGTLPGAQGWFFVPVGLYSQTLSGGAVNLDTSFGSMTQAGYFRADRDIDSTAGVRLSFSAQLLAETHAGTDRAGFSVIMLDRQRKGIELGFWSSPAGVFAQGGPGFTRAENTSFATGAMARYTLQLLNGQYTLRSGPDTLLSGAMRDYSSFGFPYTTANFLFFGDDTSSAAASVRLASVAIAPVPEPSEAAMMLCGLAVLGLAVRMRARKRCGAVAEYKRVRVSTGCRPCPGRPCSDRGSPPSA